jgi:hypothetical protein
MTTARSPCMVKLTTDVHDRTAPKLIAVIRCRLTRKSRNGTVSDLAANRILQIKELQLTDLNLTLKTMGEKTGPKLTCRLGENCR